MGGPLKVLVIGALSSFTAYVFVVEPNAAADPFGSIARAAKRLATTCDRDPTVCDLARAAANGALRVSRVGWGLATGEGRLVYISEDSERASLRNLSLGDFKTWQARREAATRNYRANICD
ncbi:MAG: hypothetical protein ACR2PG_10395 [Hyphomicrobiaceae bacterium]